LLAIGGLLLVFPALVGAIVQPLTGLDVGAFMPGLSGLGVRVGYNVLLGACVLAAVAMLQRARAA